MTQLDVLPAALSAAARLLRDVRHEMLPVRPAETGDAALTAALSAYADAWAGTDLVEAAEQCAQWLDNAAQEYAAVESLLLPRALR